MHVFFLHSMFMSWQASASHPGASSFVRTIIFPFHRAYLQSLSNLPVFRTERWLSEHPIDDSRWRSWTWCLWRSVEDCMLQMCQANTLYQPLLKLTPRSFAASLQEQILPWGHGHRRLLAILHSELPRRPTMDEDLATITSYANGCRNATIQQILHMFIGVLNQRGLFTLERSMP